MTLASKTLLIARADPRESRCVVQPRCVVVGPLKRKRFHIRRFESQDKKLIVVWRGKQSKAALSLRRLLERVQESVFAGSGERTRSLIANCVLCLVHSDNSDAGSYSAEIQNPVWDWPTVYSAIDYTTPESLEQQQILTVLSIS